MFFCLLAATLAAEGIDFAEHPKETHRVLQVDNEQVRVWKTTILPHSPLKMHRHNAPRVVVPVKGGTLKKITESGEVSYLDFETGKAVWLEADPEGELHGDINESDEPVEVFVIELKD